MLGMRKSNPIIIVRYASAGARDPLRDVALAPDCDVSGERQTSWEAAPVHHAVNRRTRQAGSALHLRQSQQALVRSPRQVGSTELRLVARALRSRRARGRPTNPLGDTRVDHAIPILHIDENPMRWRSGDVEGALCVNRAGRESPSEIINLPSGRVQLDRFAASKRTGPGADANNATNERNIISQALLAAPSGAGVTAYLGRTVVYNQPARHGVTARAKY